MEEIDFEAGNVVIQEAQVIQEAVLVNKWPIQFVVGTHLIFARVVFSLSSQ